MRHQGVDSVYYHQEGTRQRYNRAQALILMEHVWVWYGGRHVDI